MSKIKYIIFVILLTFILTGCNGNVTRDLRHDGFSISSSEFTCNYLMPENEKDTSTKKIDFMNDRFAVDEDGTLYEVSLGQKYSNNQNCKKASFDKKVVALMDDTIIKAEDGKFYYAPGNNNNTSYSEVTVNDNSYQIYQMLLSEETSKKVMTANQSTGSYYVLSTDGNIYNYVITRADYNSPYVLSEKKVAYYKVDYNSSIIDFYYNASSNSMIYIKTEEEIYRLQATNAEECSKYADVSCKYKLKKDETLTKYYKDKILYYGPSILITTYGKIFT